MYRYLLFVVFCLLAISCQKEENQANPSISAFYDFSSIDEAKINEIQNEGNWESTGWGVYEDIIFPGTSIEHATSHDTETFGFKTLKCEITGGDAYNNAFFTNTIAKRWEGLDWYFNEVTEFEFTLRFYPETIIDCENPDLSEIEGLEFTFQHVMIPFSYGWGVQWSKTNTWSYWDDQKVDNKAIGWVNFQGVNDCILANEWNTLKLVGTSRDDQVHYLELVINENNYSLDVQLPKVSTPNGWAENFLQVGFQINGNTAIRNDHPHGVDPVAVFLDEVKLNLGTIN